MLQGEAIAGAVDHEGHVSFTLYAPGKRSVHLIGDFNDWDELADEAGRGLNRHYQRLCRLRRRRDALRSPYVAIDVVAPERQCLAYRRWSDSGDAAVIVADFSDHTQTLTVSFPGGRWNEFFSDQQADMNGQVEVEVDHLAAKIFLRA